jgi:polynucleotide 3'-phosphatase
MGDIAKLLGGNRVSKPQKDTRNLNGSQKMDLLQNWRIIGTHLIKNVPITYDLVKKRGSTIKIAGFDLDSTLIETKSGMKFARGVDDWKWWGAATSTSMVPTKLKQTIDEGYLVVIFTNQGGVVADKTRKSYVNFTTKLSKIISTIKLGVDQPCEILVFAASMKPKGKKVHVSEASAKLHDLYRKPQVGMWNELTTFLTNGDLKLDLNNSFYVGDAAGRKTDFLDSDKEFACNIGVKFYTPEQFFQSGEESNEQTNKRTNVTEDKEVDYAK